MSSSGGLSAAAALSIGFRKPSVKPQNTQFFTANPPPRLTSRYDGALRWASRKKLVCNCSSTGGENDSKRVLDAFFLGKALAEALNERVESAVGEFLSVVGRLQAEQQKQVQDFQEDVLERAKIAKERAALEAMEAQGLIPKSAAANMSTSTVSQSPVTAPSAPSSSAKVSSDPPATTSVSNETDESITGTEPLVEVVSIDE